MCSRDNEETGEGAIEVVWIIGYAEVLVVFELVAEGVQRVSVFGTA